MKWTQGEWRVTNEGADKRGFYTHQIGTHEQTVAYTFEPGLKRLEQHANAKILASAPALYKALEAIAGNYAPEDGALINQIARDAMKKARL